MKKYIKIISIILIVLALAGLGIGYGFFNYTKTSETQKVIAGSLYLTLNEGEDTINLTNIFPETKEEARSHSGNTLTFTLKGKNTSDNKAINYEILLNNGSAQNGKTRYNSKDLVFDLIEIGDNNEETYILDAVSYDTLENQRIWVDKISENTNSEIEKTYKLRMWLSDDVIISDTDTNADYTSDEFKNGYASVKIAVEGDMEEKQQPLTTAKLNVLSNNNETQISNVIENNDTENNQDTFALTITSSNSNVEFVYDNNAVVSNINIDEIKAEISDLVADENNNKVDSIDSEVVSSSFAKQFVIDKNKKVTFVISLRSKTGNNEATDLHYVLAKGNNTIQDFVKHIDVVGFERALPTIEFVNKVASYTGSAITLESVVIKNSDATAYTGEAKYTYYKGNGCTGQEINGAPINAGVYSVKVSVNGLGNDGDTSRCGTITINQKTLTASVDSCSSKIYDGTTSADCIISLSGIVAGEQVNATGQCTTDSAGSGNDKDVTCLGITLAGNDKNNYILSSASTSKQDVLDIAKKPLNIKADDKDMLFGSSAPTYSYKVEGLANGENESVLSGNITYIIKEGTTTISDVSAIDYGTYTIVPSGLSAANYDINYTNGTLYVKRSVTASINTCTDREYNENTNVTCTFNLSGLANGDSLVASGTCNTSSADAGNNLNVTCTNLTLSGANIDKYMLASTTTSKENAVNITPKNVTVTFHLNGNVSQTDSLDVASVENTVTRSCQISTGTTCEITSPTIVAPSGFTALGYSTSADIHSVNWNQNANKAVSNNANWYAQSIKEGTTHTVTFYRNGASTQTNGSNQAVNDDSVTRTCNTTSVYNGAVSEGCTVKSPTIVAADGFTVLGYNTSNIATTSTWSPNTDKDNINSDLTYYAITKSNTTFTITFNKNGNTSQTPNGGSTSSADTVSESCYRYNGLSTCEITSPMITAPSETPTVIGYSASSDNHIRSWSVNTAVPISGDATYYAQTTKETVTYNVTYNNNGATSNAAENDSCSIAATYNGVAQNTTCSITTAGTPVKTYNIFEGWKSSTDNNVYAINTSYTVTADTTLTAQWQEVRADRLSYDNTNSLGINCTGANANAQCALDAIYNALPKVTITYNANGGTVSTASKTILPNSTTYGELIEATPTSGNLFAGWYTEASGGTAVTSTTAFTNGSSPTTLYAHYVSATNIKCKRVTNTAQLHTETCQQSSNYCYADGYYVGGSKGTTAITYGNAKEVNTSLVTGDAFDCKVTTNGGYTERFYYVSDRWIPGEDTDNFDNQTAVLIYYKNFKDGAPSDLGVAYNSNNINYNGPVTAVTHLPTTSTWSNISLNSTSRMIYACDNGNCSNTPSLYTNNGSNEITPNPFNYGTTTVARLLTVPEIKKGCTSISNKTTVDSNRDLTACNFIFERTRYANTDTTTYPTFGPWLETPRASNSDNVWIARAYYRSVSSYSASNTNVGVRPVIEISKSNIVY